MSVTDRLEGIKVGTKNKMSHEDRAKQFMPFAALRGYEQALREKEKVVVDRKELSEERMGELDEIMHSLKVTDIVTVIYFQKDNYIKKTGMISKIDVDSRYVKVVNTKIFFDDIYSILT